MKVSGFTLIELLVVISIIGVLASALLATLQDARISAQYVVAKNEMKILIDALYLAPPNQPTLSITGSGCSECVCRVSYGAPSDLRNISEISACYARIKLTLDNINANSTYIDNVESLYRDPWGSPYLFDENELEYPSNPCRQDWISTAGPDGVRGTTDDFIRILPFRTVTCS